MGERGEIDGITFTHAELYAALYNTGLTYLENVFDETLVRLLKMRAPRISQSAGGDRREKQKYLQNQESVKLLKNRLQRRKGMLHVQINVNNLVVV